MCCISCSKILVSFSESVWIAIPPLGRVYVFYINIFWRKILNSFFYFYWVVWFYFLRNVINQFYFFRNVVFETAEEFFGWFSSHRCSIHNYSPLYYSRCYNFFILCAIYGKITDVICFVSAVYVVVTLLLLWSNLNFHLMLAILYIIWWSMMQWW